MGTTYTLYKPSKKESFELGKGTWFQIGKSDEYCAFKISELWTQATLATFVRRAMVWRSNQLGVGQKAAENIAERIINWAGDDIIVMVDDTVDYITVLKELGLWVKGSHYKDIGSVWGAFWPDQTEEEKAENLILCEEVAREEFTVMNKFWFGKET